MSCIEKFIIGDIVDEDEKEIIKFGIERIKVALIGFILTIVTGIILGEFVETLLFIICLLPLRQNAGGYHMKSKWACAVCSCLFLLISVITIKYLAVGRAFVLLTILASVVLIWILAPVGNPDHVLDESEIKVYRFRARVICLVELSLFFVFFLVVNNKWYISVALSELSTAALLGVGSLQEKLYKKGMGQNV